LVIILRAVKKGGEGGKASYENYLMGIGDRIDDDAMLEAVGDGKT
jgi:hypothetical protein